MVGVITAERIGQLIGDAPAWAKIALTVPQERLREDAKRELGQHIYAALFQPVTKDAAQLALPL
jgi:hypothetical protein